MINNFSELNKYLEQFVPGSILKGDFYNPDRMLELLPLVGNPEKECKVIHVAGTSGKTSTCYYISELLRAHNTKVGLSVSPHVIQINERLQINGVPLEERKMCELFNELVSIPGLVELKPTYFELLTTFSFWAFAKLECTHVVMEVGLGGLKDATNVVESEDKISVISDIGLDHTRILGDTVEKIAHQKVGIVQPFNNVFSYNQEESVMEIIREACKQNKAVLHNYSQENLEQYASFLPHLPLYQKRNWLLAKQVSDYVAERDGLPKIGSDQLLQTQGVSIPGRMQMINVKDKIIVLDGAHNPQKLTAFCLSIRNEFPDAKIKALIAFSQAKQETLEKSVKLIAEITNNVICTEFSVTAGLPHIPVSVSNLAQVAKKVGIKSVVLQSDPQKACNLLIDDDDNVDIRIIVGSFYLIGTLFEKGVIEL